jgi:hypothetical protein
MSPKQCTRARLDYPQKPFDFCNNIEGTTDVPCRQEHFRL